MQKLIKFLKFKNYNFCCICQKVLKQHFGLFQPLICKQTTENSFFVYKLTSCKILQRRLLCWQISKLFTLDRSLLCIRSNYTQIHIYFTTLFVYIFFRDLPRWGFRKINCLPRKAIIQLQIIQFFA